jgi:hypothetical protein
VLKAIFGLAMTAEDLVIFQRHSGRISPPLGGSKETYLIIGRRGGKSFISALVTCFIACFIDFSPFITVGETLAVMCLAKDKDQARIVFRYVTLKSMIVDQRADESGFAPWLGQNAISSATTERSRKTRKQVGRNLPNTESHMNSAKKPNQNCIWPLFPCLPASGWSFWTSRN